MKISVILPTYKPKSYIYECLISINSQTFNKSDYELIVILNGCNEPYEGNIRRFISTKLSDDLNINFIQTDQGGVSNARNIGLDNAKGEYITFIDDDDYVSPSYIEELLNNASTDVVSLSNTIAFDDKTGEHDENYRISKAFKENKTTNINDARKFFSGPVMKLIHKDIIGDRRFDVTFRIGEDGLFMFLISNRIYKCKFTSKDAIYYRRYRDNSAIQTRGNFLEYTKDEARSAWSFSKTYFSKPLEYNFTFYLTRMLAKIKSWSLLILRDLKRLATN